jgi:hypothetical protein
MWFQVQYNPIKKTNITLSYPLYANNHTSKSLQIRSKLHHSQTTHHATTTSITSWHQHRCKHQMASLALDDFH